MQAIKPDAPVFDFLFLDVSELDLAALVFFIKISMTDGRDVLTTTV